MKQPEISIKQKISIREVAKAAEVSIGTVSNYLNGRHVSAALTTRIRAAIEELDFSRSMIAGGMRNQRSQLIGVCVPYPTFSNYATLVDELDINVSDSRFELLQVLSRQDLGKEFERIKNLVAFSVSGIMLVPTFEPMHIVEYLLKNNMPTVIVSRPLPDDRVDQVTVNHEEAMYQVAKAMIESGRRCILFIVRYPELLVTIRRIAALVQAIEDSGFSVRYEVVVSPITKAGFSDVFLELLASIRPDGVILSNDTIAAWTIGDLRRQNITYPDQIALASLHKPDWLELAGPGLIYVEQPTSEMARIAWDCLHSRILSPAIEPRRIVLSANVRTHAF